MAFLMKTVFLQHCTVGDPGPGRVLGTWECRDHRVQNNDHGTWTAESVLVMLKGRAGSLRAVMGRQEHAYINIGRGPLSLINLW